MIQDRLSHLAETSDDYCDGRFFDSSSNSFGDEYYFGENDENGEDEDEDEEADEDGDDPDEYSSKKSTQ